MRTSADGRRLGRRPRARAGPARGDRRGRGGHGGLDPSALVRRRDRAAPSDRSPYGRAGRERRACRDDRGRRSRARRGHRQGGVRRGRGPGGRGRRRGGRHRSALHDERGDPAPARHRGLPAMTTHLWWYTARGAGIVAWVLATGAVVLGLLLSGRFGRRPKPAWLLDLHRFMGGLVVVFLGVHLAALVADSTVQFGLSDLAVPMASAWRPGAVAWGVVAAWLLIAVELTSLAQRRLPRRLWHAVHLSSFVVFGASTVHA